MPGGQTGIMKGMFPIFSAAVLLLLPAFSLLAQDHRSWRDYGGASDAAQYSALNQINRSNVSKLQVAWTYPTGDDNKYFFNPLVVDGMIYVLAKNNSIVALDAATGKEIWALPPDPDTKVITNRGINYWESKDRSDRRLLFASNHFLRAIDARTGKPIASFGQGGRVDLKEGLDRDPKDDSAGAVHDAGPGVRGSADSRLGDQSGIWLGARRHPRLRCTHGQAGLDLSHRSRAPASSATTRGRRMRGRRVGGANVWGELSVDEKRGILYAPTASAKYNFYGADRSGANLFGDCLLALDARTGKRLWHFQMVHHDIWDYDDATAPKLLTVRHEGKTVDVVAQVSKQGFVWVFDRVTGKPLWPIEERPVPASDMPGEETWPTQPFPTKPPPFARQKFTVDDLSPFLSPQDRARFRDEILSARNEGLFTPPRPAQHDSDAGQQRRSQLGRRRGRSYERHPCSSFPKILPAMLKLAKDPEADKALAASAGERFYTGFGFMIAQRRPSRHRSALVFAYRL